MSKKMRIAISCILAVLAFGLGIAVYARENGNKAEVATADSEAVYFVDEAGKITIPTEPAATTDAEKLANKVNRGRSADNPFFVLEIVPYDMYAEFGYKIAGCEPIDMDMARWYGLDLPSEDYTYKDATPENPNPYVEYGFWQEEVPAKFPTSDSKFIKTGPQYGVMKEVTDNSGNYSREGVEYLSFYDLPGEYQTAYEGERYKKDGETYVVDVNGQYIKRDKIVAKANGELKWIPVASVVENVKIEASESLWDKYAESLHVPDENGEFKCVVPNVTYYYYNKGREYVHKNTFVLESVGLAYKMVGGVRKDIRVVGTAEEKAQMWADVEEFSKNCIVYTVTPEELNINLGLIERADMIYISMTETNSGYIDNNKKYGKASLFAHATPNAGIAGKTKNVAGASYKTNLFDWDAVVKIYEAATNPLKMTPIIMDTTSYNGDVAGKQSKKVPVVTAKGDKGDINTDGSQNNLYKLFLLLHQMPPTVLESFYGTPAGSTGVFSSQVVSGQTKKDGTPLKTGVFNFDKIPYIAAKTEYRDHVKKTEYTDAKTFWGVNTMLPWQLVQTMKEVKKEHPDTYYPYFDTFEIKSDAGLFFFDSGAAQNSLQGSMYLYAGGTEMNGGFDNVKGVSNDQYGYAVYDYFASIGVTRDDKDDTPAPTVTPAEILYYLLNGLKNQNSPTATISENYKILEIQPSPIYIDGVTNGDSVFWTTFIKSYANTTGSVIVDRITTAELIGKSVEYLSEYDLVYFGMNKDSNDVTMNTTFVYAHTGPKMTFSYGTGDDGSSSLFGWLYTRNDGDITKELTGSQIAIEKQFVYSGNDITRRVREKLLKYGEQGYPILFADGFFGSVAPTDEDDIVGTIDHNSYVYDMASYIDEDNYLDMKTISDDTWSTHHAEVQNLRNALRKSVEVEWSLVSPKQYNVDASINNCEANDSDYLDGQTLQFEFTLKAPDSHRYRVVLSTDINGDGKYTSDEIVLSGANFSVREVLGVGSKSVSNGTLENGKKYRVTRENIDRVGSVCWKLDLVDVTSATNQYVAKSASGVSAIKATVANADADGADKRIPIKVLQIVSNNRMQVYLPTASDISGNTVNIAEINTRSLGDFHWDNGTAEKIRDGMNERSQWFYEDTKDLKDFKITFERIKVSELETKLSSDPNYFKTNAYDMVVLGFADAYVGIKSATVIDAIERFRLSGKAILYTHDNSSMVGHGATGLSKNYSWGAELTLRFRDAFGMDRYDVLGFTADSDKKTLKTDAVDGRADIPYAPSSTTDDGSIMTATGGNDYMLAQGLSDGILYRHSSDFDYYNLNVGQVTRVNKGGITEYPYTITETISVASTHPQYYQLDLETEDIVVWYTLGGKNGEGACGEKWNDSAHEDVLAYYKSTPMDTRNNYYIYNINNVTYSGMGHNGLLSRQEVRLFINTFIAAYRASANSARAQVENEEVSGDKNGYYLLVDVDPQNADEIRQVNDAQTEYCLQKKVSDGVYVADTPKVGNAKRVYFQINDGSDYAIREYNLKFKVDGTDMELAVFRKSNGAFVNHSFEGTNSSQINKDTYGEIFYVDVPIRLETVTDGATETKAVVDTTLEISVNAQYKLSSTMTSWIPQADPGITKVTITPRGLFDLD